MALIFIKLLKKGLKELEIKSYNYFNLDVIVNIYYILACYLMKLY